MKKIAFIANTDRHLDDLEKMLMSLCTHGDVERVVAVGAAAKSDIQMVVDQRCQRFSKEVDWHHENYARFVFHSVANGIADVAVEELERNDRLCLLTSSLELPKDGWVFGNCRVTIDQVPQGPEPFLVLSAGDEISDDGHPRFKPLGPNGHLLVPGRIFQRYQDGVSYCAVVTFDDSVTVQFMDRCNHLLSPERLQQELQREQLRIQREREQNQKRKGADGDDAASEGTK